jgi:hypothetical protein
MEINKSKLHLLQKNLSNPIPLDSPTKLAIKKDNFHKAIFRLTNATFCGIEIADKGSLDNAKSYLKVVN